MKNIHIIVLITVAIINTTCIHNPLFYYINIIYTVNCLWPCTIARNGVAMASLHLQTINKMIQRACQGTKFLFTAKHNNNYKNPSPFKLRLEGQRISHNLNPNHDKLKPSIKAKRWRIMTC